MLPESNMHVTWNTATKCHSIVPIPIFIGECHRIENRLHAIQISTVSLPIATNAKRDELCRSMSLLFGTTYDIWKKFQGKYLCFKCEMVVEKSKGLENCEQVIPK